MIRYYHQIPNMKEIHVQSKCSPAYKEIYLNMLNKGTWVWKLYSFEFPTHLISFNKREPYMGQIALKFPEYLFVPSDTSMLVLQHTVIVLWGYFLTFGLTFLGETLSQQNNYYEHMIYKNWTRFRLCSWKYESRKPF